MILAIIISLIFKMMYRLVYREIKQIEIKLKMKPSNPTMFYSLSLKNRCFELGPARVNQFVLIEI